MDTDEDPGTGGLAVAIKDLGGAGRHVLLIHGFGSDRMSWLANGPVLQRSMHLWALDLPGHGGSGMQVGDGGVETLAGAVADALLREGLKDLAVVGHSLGGGIASILAATRPDLVNALVLIAPAGLGTGVDGAFLDAFPRLETLEETETLLRRLVSRPRLINRQLVTLVQRQLALPMAREALASIAGGIRRSGPVLAAAMRVNAEAGVPRLVIWGKSDLINPPDRAALEAFGGRHVLVPEAGHLPHVEAAALVNAEIADFLSADTDSPARH